MKTSPEAAIHMTVVSRSFSATDLVAGHPALDLVNTVTARNTATPLDWLDSYERLLEWAGLANILDDKELRNLRKQAGGSVSGAARALARIKQLREALQTAYAALLTGKRVPEAVLAEIGSVWQEAQSRRRLEYSDNRIDARVNIDRSGLDLIRDVLAGSAIELLRSLPSDRARVCRGERCGWLFIDSSKGGSACGATWPPAGTPPKRGGTTRTRKAGRARNASSPATVLIEVRVPYRESGDA